MADQKWWQEIADNERLRDLTPEEDALAMGAYSAWLQGDPGPLAEYLRSGAPLHFIFRRELVEALAGEGGEFRLEMVKRTSGRGNVISKLKTHWRDIRIGRHIQERLPYYNNQVEAAVADACKEFDEKRGVVLNAWSKFKASSWFLSANDRD